MFTNDRRFLRLAALVVGAVAVCKGLHFPNLWSATQAQIDYSHGFVKRGLFGAVVTRSLDLSHYARFAVFSCVALMIVLVLLVVFVGQSGAMERVGSGAAVVAFASSLAVTNIANLVGYLDIVQLGLTLMLLLIRRPLLRFFVAIPIGASCILLHESFLLSLLPVLLFSFYADSLRDRRLAKTAGLKIVVLACAALVLTTVLAMRPSLSADQIQAFEQELSSRVDFPLRQDFFPVLGLSASGNSSYIHSFYKTSLYRSTQMSVILALAPVVAFLIVCLHRFCRASEDKRTMQFGFLGVLCAGLAPLGIHLLAGDVARFNSEACTAFFLAFLLLVRSLPEIRITLTPAMRNGMFLVVALGMASGEGLLDVNAPRQFPFVRSVMNHGQYLTKDHRIIQPGR